MDKKQTLRVDRAIYQNENNESLKPCRKTTI